MIPEKAYALMFLFVIGLTPIAYAENIEIDRQEYSHGDRINVSGEIEMPDDAILRIDIITPNGDYEWWLNRSSDYELTIIPRENHPMWQEFDTYVIQVGYVFDTKDTLPSDVNIVDSVTFELVPNSEDDARNDNNEDDARNDNNEDDARNDNNEDDARNDAFHLELEQLRDENNILKKENEELRKQVDELTERIQDLQTIVMEQIKVIMNTLSNLKLQ